MWFFKYDDARFYLYILGQENFDQLRKAAFHNTDIVLICFAVDHLPSFQNVRELVTISYNERESIVIEF